jgi:hypothetical protein
MAKRKQSTKNNTTSIFLGVIGIFIIVFGILFIATEWSKRKEMENVKGESTVSTESSMIPPKDRTANAGEACGRSIGRGCKKDLICAPLAPSYRLLTTKATEVESMTETETVSTEVRTCIGKSEDEIKSGCLPYIPYYGACVKKGVWPPPSIKPTPTPGPCYQPRICTGNTCTGGPPVGMNGIEVNMPQCTPTPTPISNCIPKPPCVDGVVDPKTGAKLYCDPKPGTIFCTPTPTPPSTTPGQVSCVWCGLNCVDKSKIQACIMIAPPAGYTCANINNVCTKVANGVVVTPAPAPISVAPVQNVINRIRSLLGRFGRRN